MSYHFHPVALTGFLLETDMLFEYFVRETKKNTIHVFESLCSYQKDVISTFHVDNGAFSDISTFETLLIWSF